MPSTITEDKKQLRDQVRAQLAALTPQELEESDAALFDRFLALPQVQRADTISPFGALRARSRTRPG